VPLLHANIRRALNVAVKWGLLVRNVALLVDPPPRQHHEVMPLTTDEARAFIAAASGDRLAARWVVGLSLGLRQGETLGLWWEDIDLAQGIVRVRRQLQRDRHSDGTLSFGALKTARSRRTLSLPGPLIRGLEVHRRQQEVERAEARYGWADPRLVFATPLGTPIDPSNDNRAFKRLLARAGLRDARLHDRRHTAASLLLAQGVHPRVVMDLLGHSQIALPMNTYSHVMPAALREAAESMASVLWDDGHRSGTDGSAVSA
jgi:integrase